MYAMWVGRSLWIVSWYLQVHFTQFAHKITTSHRYDFSARASLRSLAWDDSLCSTGVKDTFPTSERYSRSRESG